MNLQGLDYITPLAAQSHYSAKLVFNQHGAIFFPVTAEHRNQSGPEIRYADDYKGNALAAMLSPGKIEVRYHKDFTDAQVALMLMELLQLPELACLHPCRATYQGRPLLI